MGNVRPSIALWLATLVALVCGAACGDADDKPSGEALPAAEATPAAPARPALTAADGAKLVEKLECNRCHAGTALLEPPETKQCFGCHVSIAAGKMPKAADGSTPARDKKIVAGWKKNVEHLRFAPSLSGVGRIIDPSWVQRYLVAPHDLRPGLHADMPRLPIGEPEAAAIAAHFAEQAQFDGEAAAGAPRGDAGRGRNLFTTKGCAGCHTFTGARTDPPPLVKPGDGPDRALAPDLRFARDRVIRARLVDWILDPRSIKPDAAMVKQNLSREEATDLAAFILEAPLDEPPRAQTPSRLPVLDRAVTYDEVAERVLSKICWHCHAQPDVARGDGGPGNTGGFGFEPRLVDLSSYASISGGFVDKDGTRKSLFSPSITGEPVLLAVLLERGKEARGTFGPLRGMPLGLPPLSAEDIQLVETWIAQGHPR